jgi:Thiopurine S-methyltransferase (TPMT)
MQSLLARGLDCAYDRGPLEALNIQDRENYAKVMASLLGTDFRYN